MSLTTILTILSLFALCASPFVFISLRQKKSEKKFLQVLADYALRNHLPLTQHEVNGQQAIGISDAGNAMLFLKRRKNNDHIQQVDLTQVERSYVNQPVRGSIDGNYSSPERVELRFVFRDKSKQEAIFELYNMEYDSMSLNGELQMAEKWNAIANGRIRIGKS